MSFFLVKLKHFPLKHRDLIIYIISCYFSFFIFSLYIFKYFILIKMQIYFFSLNYVFFVEPFEIILNYVLLE